jgi:hypothetical protein
MMPARLDPEARALVAVLVVGGESYASIARQTGISERSVGRIARDLGCALQQNESDYQALVLEAFRSYWLAVIAQAELAADRDWLLDFPKEKFADLHVAFANQAFRFLSVLDFSDDDTVQSDAACESSHGWTD